MVTAAKARRRDERSSILPRLAVVTVLRALGVARLKRARAAALIGLCLAGSAAIAADWRIVPRVSVRETYTDNVRLAGRGAEESDFVTEVNPGVSVAARGARLQLQADYSLKYRTYASNSDANGHSQSLRSNALVDLWDKKLFLQAGAGIAQQDISTLGAQSASDQNITSNRTEVRTASISPYWRSRLGTWGNLQARYSWNRSETDGESSVLNSESQAVNLGLSSGISFGNFGWSVNYSKQTVESSSGQFTQRDLESTTGTVSYLILPTLTGSLTFGKDHNSFGNVRGETGGIFHSIGLQWVLSPRTRISGNIGERYYGTSYALNAEHRSRRTTWTIGYQEQIIATPGVFSVPSSVDTAAVVDALLLTQFPDPVERQQAVLAFMALSGTPASLRTSVDFLTNQVSLQKRFQGTTAYRLQRGTALFTVFRDNRTSETTGATLLGTDPFALSSSVVQTGYSAVLSWRHSSQTASTVSLGQTKSQLVDVARDDTNLNFRVGLTHRFHRQVSGSLEYRWLDRDSTSAATIRENAISGSLSMTFF